MKTITFTSPLDNKPITIRVELIDSISDDGNVTLIYVNGRRFLLRVKEKYERVLNDIGWVKQ